MKKFSAIAMVIVFSIFFIQLLYAIDEKERKEIFALKKDISEYEEAKKETQNYINQWGKYRLKCQEYLQQELEPEDMLLVQEKIEIAQRERKKGEKNLRILEKNLWDFRISLEIKEALYKLKREIRGGRILPKGKPLILKENDFMNTAARKRGFLLSTIAKNKICYNYIYVQRPINLLITI